MRAANDFDDAKPSWRAAASRFSASSRLRRPSQSGIDQLSLPSNVSWFQSADLEVASVSIVQNDPSLMLTMRSGSRPTVTLLSQRQAVPPSCACVNVRASLSTETLSSPTPAAP
jgi:hypothetical protein